MLYIKCLPHLPLSVAQLIYLNRQKQPVENCQNFTITKHQAPVHSDTSAKKQVWPMELEVCIAEEGKKAGLRDRVHDESARLASVTLNKSFEAFLTKVCLKLLSNSCKYQNASALKYTRIQELSTNTVLNLLIVFLPFLSGVLEYVILSQHLWA